MKVECSANGYLSIAMRDITYSQLSRQSNSFVSMTILLSSKSEIILFIHYFQDETTTEMKLSIKFNLSIRFGSWKETRSTWFSGNHSVKCSSFFLVHLGCRAMKLSIFFCSFYKTLLVFLVLWIYTVILLP